MSELGLIFIASSGAVSVAMGIANAPFTEVLVAIPAVLACIGSALIGVDFCRGFSS